MRRKKLMIIVIIVWIDYFTIRVECCKFLNLYGRYKTFFSMGRFKQLSPYRRNRMK